MAFAYADMVGDTPDNRYTTFAEQQINYILGDNPRNASYMCGFGENPPVRPHHRTAHGSWNDQLTDPAPNRHVLYGALVGGPASPDDFDYSDDRGDWIANEVACDYNAGFTASLARMAQVYGGEALPDSEFPPAEVSYGKEMFVQASVLEDADTFTRIRCVLNNRSAWPARSSESLAFRVYLNLSEVFDAGLSLSDVEVDASFTDGAVVTGPHVADAAAGLYYIAVNYSGINITPGPGSVYRKECQLGIGLASGSPTEAWNRSNDPSLAGLPIGQDAIVQTETMPVYDAGVFVYGEEGVSDCDDNGVPDADDIAAGAADVDGNGVLDVCQSDCDGDGLPDSWEVSLGAPDCNSNGVPDACDIDNGESDVDGDGIPDACQLEGVSWSMDINDAWDGGFVGALNITNNTGGPIDNWEVSATVVFTIDSVWNAVLVGQVSGVATFTHPAWATSIENGQTLVIGFQAAGPSTAPSLVTVNGTSAQPE
jgi:hypothetical protein